jgi:hypothetical protein
MKGVGAKRHDVPRELTRYASVRAWTLAGAPRAIGDSVAVAAYLVPRSIRPRAHMVFRALRWPERA